MREITALELAEWHAYAIIEPFGAPASFWRAGVIAAMIRNVNRAKESDQVAKPADFFPGRQPWEEDEEESDDMMRDLVVEQVLATFGRKKGPRSG